MFLDFFDFCRSARLHKNINFGAEKVNKSVVQAFDHPLKGLIVRVTCRFRLLESILYLIERIKMMLLLRLSEADWAHFDAEFLVIANVAWSNVNNRKTGRLLGGILDDGLISSG
jgi:hypothetical protein